LIFAISTKKKLPFLGAIMRHTSKYEQFKVYFIELFQESTEEVFAEAKKVFAVAGFITDHLGQADLSTIQTNLKDHKTPVYIGSSKESKASLLFGSLAVEDYARNISSSEELMTLNQIEMKLMELYAKPSVDTMEKFNSLTENANQWLDNFALNSIDLAKAKELCLSLYAMVRIMEINIGRYSSTAKFLASKANGIDFDKITNQFGLFLAKAEVKINELEAKILASPAADAMLEPELEIPVEPHTFEVETVSPVAQAIRNHFSVQCKAILERDNLSLEKKISKILKLIDANQNDLNILTTEKKTRAILVDKKTMAQALLQAIDHSTTQDILSIMATHPESYNDILTNSTPHEKEELLKQIAGVVAVPPAAAAYNAHTSTKTPGNVLELELTDTTSTNRRLLDTECKDTLRILAKKHLGTLTKELLASNEETDSISMNDLTQLLAENRAIRGVMSKSSDILQRVMINQKTLTDIAAVENKVNTFVNIHHGFFVKMSLSLSKYLGGFFKSSKADKVEQALQMQTRLSRLSENYRQQLIAQTRGVTEDAEIPEPIKTALLQLKEETNSSLMSASRPTADYNSVFTEFRAQFNRLATQDPAEPNPDNSNEPSSGPR
jgi:hypothetical protein